MDNNDNEFDWGTDDFEPVTQQQVQPVQNQPIQNQQQVQPMQNQPVTQQQAQPVQNRQQAPRRQQRRSGVPNPNQQVQRMRVNQQNYNQGGTPIQQGVTPQQRQMNNQASNPAQHVNQQMNNMQGNVQNQQMNNVQGVAQQNNAQGNMQTQQVPNAQGQQMVDLPQEFSSEPNTQVNTQRPKSKLGGVFVVIVLVIIGVLAFKFLKKDPLVAEQEVYETSGRYAYDNLLTNITNFSAEALDDCVGTEDGDSYLAQEYAYVNGVPLREEFITRVCSLVSFSYPSANQLSTTGVEMLDKDGKPITIESSMNNGEKLKATVPDYALMLDQMESDREYIVNMMTTAGYKPEDYTYSDDMVNLFCQYMCDKTEIPTKEVELSMPIGTGADGSPNISDDSALDDLLFGSQDLRNMCAKFSQICVGYTGFKDEQYETEEEQDNPEWKKWNKLFQKYYDEDNGIFNENTSKWEPWYLRDDEDNFILDENGEKIVNYYSVKDDKGKDWIEPDKKVMVHVTKTRQVEDKWIEETGIRYNWIGTHYLQTEYDGEYSIAFRVGDGSIEHPAGIGTSIITKVLCTDDNYHDVRVTLMGYWIDQNAIDYAESFSTKNKGFTTESVIRLISYEAEVENLENVPITFETTELTLCDSNSNVTARTGTLYGYTKETTLQPGEKKFVNDWGASTELDQKYVCWGKSFGRTFPMIYFNILAGTGEIPPYSAYELFKGDSSIEGKQIGGGENSSETSEASSEATSEVSTEETAQ